MIKYVALTLFWCASLLADSLEVTVEPREPVVNENFKVVFEVTTEQGTDPIVNFDPLNVEVISRSETGIRTRTTYINGRLSTERSLTIVYEMVATRGGSAFLRNINVDLNGSRIEHRTVRINILKTPKRARDILVRAEVDKDEAFVGESILVRYYLYNRAPVVSTDIKKFPKLENFLKRYHQEKMTAERVELNGSIYTRRVMYTAQLFASEAGEYDIDPITLGVQYSRGGSSPFDSFGLGSRYGQSRNLTVSSPSVPIRVKALPIENVPASFTGLVGKHDFKLELNKNKFVVNEPIELTLKVAGTGALELYEAPRIFTEQSVEQFETSSDLMVREDFSASKSFLYTYLGREAQVIENKRIPFSYFDPESLQFKTEYIDLGQIIIAGRSGSAAKADPAVDPDSRPVEREGPPPQRTRTFEPLYKLAATYSYNALHIAAILGLILIVCLLSVFREKLFTRKGRKKGLIAEIGRNGVNYSRLHGMISRLGSGADMKDTVRGSALSEQSKQFLIDLIDKCEAQYKESGATKSFRVPKKFLRELSSAIEEK